MSTLIMLSGGADSAAALIKLLTESDAPVFAHHIVISDRESATRHKAENLACDRLVRYCRERYRDFVYTKSLWDFQLPYFGWNLTLCAFVGARVLRSFPAARISRYAVGVIDEPHTLGMWEERVEEARATFYAGLITARLDYRPEIVWPVAHMTKREVLDFLPPEVVEMASFCRNPVENYGATGSAHAASAFPAIPARKQAAFQSPEAGYRARSSSSTVQWSTPARLKACFFGFVPTMR